MQQLKISPDIKPSCCEQIRIGANAIDDKHGPEANPLCYVTPETTPVSSTFFCNEGQRPSIGSFAVVRKSNPDNFQGDDLIWSVADFQVEGDQFFWYETQPTLSQFWSVIIRLATTFANFINFGDLLIAMI